MSSRNNKYRLQIFKKLKRGNYLITPFNVFKKVSFSTNQYLDQYKFLNDITIIKETAPLNCNDFYSIGYDCNIINNGEAVLVNWIYGQTAVQNKAIYTIILTKTTSGTCNCLYLGSSSELKTNRNRPYLFNVLKGRALNSSLYPIGKLPLNSLLYTQPTETQSIDPHIVYQYIDHNFYKSKFGEPDYNAAYFINRATTRLLYESCSVLNIRQDIYGNSIKRKSIIINDFSLSGSYTGSLIIKDDGRSNLYINTINTGSFPSNNNLLTYLSFNEKFKERIEQKKTYNQVEDSSINKNHAISLSGSYYTHGFNTTGLKSEPVGTALLCNTNPIYLEHKDYFNFNESDDFSISFFVSASLSAQNTSSAFSFLLAKQDYANNFIKNKYNKSIDYRLLKSLSGVYPFSIRYINTGSDAGKLYFSRYGGTDESFITSSMVLSESFYHITCQKTGSTFQIYINGQLDSTGSANVNGSVYNISPIFVGGLLQSGSGFVGKMDEIRIYNKALLPEQIQTLSNTDFINLQALQTNRIGNVFYNTGTVVISNPFPAYKNMLTGLSGSSEFSDASGSYYGFDGEFKSTKKIYQHEIVIPVRGHEFNYSSNPTLKKNNSANSSEFKSFVSSSNFNVYFTSIGLYNRNYELVAVAKLATPLPKYQDKDLNVIVKFDID
jgi:hypothetical protein